MPLFLNHYTDCSQSLIYLILFSAGRAIALQDKIDSLTWAQSLKENKETLILPLEIKEQT
jgi:hypothetical protein